MRSKPVRMQHQDSSGGKSYLQLDRAVDIHVRRVPLCETRLSTSVAEYRSRDVADAEYAKLAAIRSISATPAAAPRSKTKYQCSRVHDISPGDLSPFSWNTRIAVSAGLRWPDPMPKTVHCHKKVPRIVASRNASPSPQNRIAREFVQVRSQPRLQKRVLLRCRLQNPCEQGGT